MVRIEEMEEECSPARKTPARRANLLEAPDSDSDAGEPTPVRLVNRKEIGSTGIIISNFHRKYKLEKLNNE